MERTDDPSARAEAAPTLEEILEILARRGLPISEEDARRLVPSIRRTRAMAAEVRRLIDRDVEPGEPGMPPAGGRS